MVVVTWIASAPGSAAGFGTIDGGGQSREHERVTRAALDCAGAAGSGAACFEPRSMDTLAGHGREFGGVGAPDSDEVSDPSAHCDDADVLPEPYPRSREQATAALVACVDHARGRFEEAVDAAGGLVDERGDLVAGQVSLGPECRPFEAAEKRAKCMALEGFGRLLHGVQDFYAHSNWADEADPARPIGADNPPGLNRPGPSPVLDLRAPAASDAPAELSTGCYVLRDEVPGVGECQLRVTHAVLNKDKGRIDPATGVATAPTTPRGMVGDNFAKAVAGAIAESRRQWQDLGAELTARYGADTGELMVCALTHDDPVGDCRRGGSGRLVAILLAVGVGAAVVVAAVVVVRRRRAPR